MMEIEKQAKSWTDDKNIIELKAKDEPQNRGLYLKQWAGQGNTTQKWTLRTDQYLVKCDMGKNTLHLLKPQSNLK